MTSETATGRGANLSRRMFLQSASGLVAVTILGLPQTVRAAGATVRAAGALPLTMSPSPIPGRASERIEGRAKVTGEKVFARDYALADMPDWTGQEHHAMFLRAVTTDRAFLGVEPGWLPADARVILGSDLPDAIRAPRVLLNRDSLVDRKIEATGKNGSFDKPGSLEYDLLVQPGNRPDFLGQAVALLIFPTRKSWRATRDAIRFHDGDYQIYGPPLGPSPDEGRVFDPTTTFVKYMRDGETFSHATVEEDPYTAQVPAYQQKIDDVLAGHAEFIRHDFTTEMRAMDPMFMEPESGIAWHDTATRTLNLVLGTQSPDGDIKTITSMYNYSDSSPIRLDNVVLHSCYPGGGFGGRDSSPFSLMLAMAAAMCDGQPVRLMYDRFEQFRVGLKRHAAKLEGALVVAPDKSLQLVRMRMRFDGGGRKNLSPYVASLAGLCAGGSYRFPMADIYAEAVHTKNISGGSQRGFGGPQAFFATETALDEIAVKQGWDPVDLRRANIVTPKDTTVVGGPLAQELRLAEMLDAAETHPLWANRAAIKAEHAARGEVYGTGFAMSLQAYGTSSDGMAAAILMDEEGQLTLQSDAVDMGNGSATTLGVVIGHILGANASRVEMGCSTLFGQTKLVPSYTNSKRWDDPFWTAKGVGSSSACLTGLHQVHAVQQAARALFVGSLLPAAQKLWDRPDLGPDAVEWRDGVLVAKDGSTEPLPRAFVAQHAHATGLPVGVLGHAYFQVSWAEAEYDTPGGTYRMQLDGLAYYARGAKDPVPITRRNTIGPDDFSQRRSRYVWAPCVNVVGLTVRKVSGTVRIENVLSVLNAGHVHVHELVSGQSQGGVAMATSYTLLEDMPPGLEGPADGRWNLNRYHVARAVDVPLADRYTHGGRAQELILMPETEADRGAGRGIAEAVMCSIPPAISNALRDAVGVRYTSLPITAEKILEGMRG